MPERSVNITLAAPPIVGKPTPWVLIKRILGAVSGQQAALGTNLLEWRLASLASFMIFDELMAKFESQTHGMNRTFKRDSNDDTGRFYAINGYVSGNLRVSRPKQAAACGGI